MRYQREEAVGAGAVCGAVIAAIRSEQAYMPEMVCRCEVSLSDAMSPSLKEAFGAPVSTGVGWKMYQFKEYVYTLNFSRLGAGLASVSMSRSSGPKHYEQ